MYTVDLIRQYKRWFAWPHCLRVMTSWQQHSTETTSLAISFGVWHVNIQIQRHIYIYIVKLGLLMLWTSPIPSCRTFVPFHFYFCRALLSLGHLTCYSSIGASNTIRAQASVHHFWVQQEQYRCIEWPVLSLFDKN